jgi:hypothetical protein
VTVKLLAHARSQQRGAAFLLEREFGVLCKST